jgi:hypothetical protein
MKDTRTYEANVKGDCRAALKYAAKLFDLWEREGYVITSVQVNTGVLWNKPYTKAKRAGSTALSMRGERK